MISPDPSVSASSSSTTVKLLLAITLFLIVCTLSSQLGGYGFVLWSLHPLSMYLAFILLIPLSFGDLAKSLEYSSISKQYPQANGTTLHAILNIFGLIFILFGYFIAWYVHDIKGKAHFPPLTKGIVRVLHVYVGFVLILALVSQALLGISRYFGLQQLRNLHHYHTSVGKILWAISLFVLGGGIYIMLVEGTKSYATAALSIGFVAIIAQRILKNV